MKNTSTPEFIFESYLAPREPIMTAASQVFCIWALGAARQCFRGCTNPKASRWMRASLAICLQDTTGWDYRKIAGLNIQLPFPIKPMGYPGRLIHASRNAEGEAYFFPVRDTSERTQAIPTRLPMGRSPRGLALMSRNSLEVA